MCVVFEFLVCVCVCVEIGVISCKCFKFHRTLSRTSV